jgi:hypothetical protein
MVTKQAPKVALGVASYGRQEPAWWVQGFDALGLLWKEGIEYTKTYHSGVSNTDINRNRVVDDFLKEENNPAEWLMWVDADNPLPIGAIHRLLSLNKEVVSGLYYSGTIDQEMSPIAYVRNKQGAYNSLKMVRPFWEPGEILQVDAIGMGCLLTHRSVYETIQKDFTMYQRYAGGLIALKNSQVHGEIPTDPNMGNPYANTVRKGIYYEPIVQVSHKDPKFPFFMCQFMRTEDMHFCELVRDKHEIWLDTSVEVPHNKPVNWKGEHYRFTENLVPDPSPQEVDYV